eukprot:gene20921-biopygen19150
MSSSVWRGVAQECMNALPEWLGDELTASGCCGVCAGVGEFIAWGPCATCAGSGQQRRWDVGDAAYSKAGLATVRELVADWGRLVDIDLPALEAGQRELHRPQDEVEMIARAMGQGALPD